MVGKVFRHGSRAAVTFLKVKTVFRQTFPAAQLFELLSAQRMKRMDYTKTLTPLVTTICSAEPSLTADTSARTTG